MTTVAGTDESEHVDKALQLFLEALARKAPTLTGFDGLWNAYGRIYVDCGKHLELAALECDSPYFLALAVEAQNMLAAQALKDVEAKGISLRLANNNHSGLLCSKADTWGAHENYEVSVNPEKFGERILPFLVTRGAYAGAGGVRFPSAEFLAAVRPEFMRQDSGGGTTQNRAIHSTCRKEHHMGPKPSSFRYHLILGDGHRSQFNLALMVGATALALRVVEDVPDLERRLASVGSIRGEESWVDVLNRFNVLAAPGEAPRVDPQVIAIQRVYLEAAQEWHAGQTDAPEWMARLLGDWEQTLARLESMDLLWLSRRLDAFTKYTLFSHALTGSGRTWHDLVDSTQAQSELALMDHSYHTFCDPGSNFALLESRGLLEHRVGDPIVPGKEAEPFVPDTRTRARARARFIAEHAGNEQVFMDWAVACDMNDGRRWHLTEPFAEAYTEDARGPEEKKEGLPDHMIMRLLDPRMRLARLRERAAARRQTGSE